MTTQLVVSKASPPATSFLSQNSFSQKVLNFTIIVAQNAGGPQSTTIVGPAIPGQSVNISGARASARIKLAGSVTDASAEIHIFGLDQSLMNQLTTLGIVGNKLARNSVIVSAGSNPIPSASAVAANLAAPFSGLPVVFGGTINFAYGDYNRMPDVPLVISAQTGLIDNILSAQPSSYSGKTSVATVIQALAGKVYNPQTGQQGVTFENNGVSSAVLSNPYFPGTILQQIRRAADQASINAQLVDGGTTLAIWPLGLSRTTQSSVPLISPSTGMIGYPVIQPAGWLAVKSLYNPNVLQGGQVQLQSSIPQANGTWTVYQLDYALDTLTPHGKWEMWIGLMPNANSAAVGIPQVPGLPGL
jgi:hypothetical protein